MNRVTLVGNTGGEPETRSTSSGKKVSTVSLATSRTWTNDEGNEESRTEWHRLTFWGGLAGVVEKYVEKGDRLYVEGSIRYRSWTGEDGRERYVTEVHVSELVMLGSPSSGRSRPEPPPPEPSTEEEPDFSEEELMGTTDDLPF